MKELSIEEKAKRYDNLLVKLQEAKVDNKVCDERYCCVINDIVPELIESEDERVRKAILELVRQSSEILEKKNQEQMIAWLEKQGEHANFRNKIQIGDKVTRNEDGILVNLSQLNRVAKKDEKQGKNKDILEDATLDSNENGLIAETLKYKKEKQGEQKPTDKVKPKFKIGDIVKPKDGGHEPWQIMQVDMFDKKYRFKDGYVIHFSQEDDYELVEQKPIDRVEPKFHEGEWVILTAGELSTTLQIVKVDTNKKLYWFNDSTYLPIVEEECLHFWSIQDAKAGDVLEFGDHGRLVVGIVSFISKRTGRVDVYCLLEANNFKVGNYYALETINPHPATKEQRDLLFQKMKEAGYEWDAEKKKLNKIEQKLSAWSEEDEKVLDNISHILNQLKDTTPYKEDKTVKEFIDKFISLKDKVQHQTSWKPSDEQMKALSNINVTGCISYAEQGQELINLYNDLTKLKG